MGASIWDAAPLWKKHIWWEAGVGRVYVSADECRKYSVFRKRASDEVIEALKAYKVVCIDGEEEVPYIITLEETLRRLKLWLEEEQRMLKYIEQQLSRLKKRGKWYQYWSRRKQGVLESIEARRKAIEYLTS
jgi:squalene cyclase